MDTRKVVARSPQVVGKGAFGKVIVIDESYVRKMYNDLRCMLQEAMVLCYMSGSNYIVRIDSINMAIPSVSIERWSHSLRKLLKEESIPLKGKLTIFKCILMGLSHLHQMGILHCDVKLSNILVNKRTYEACLCDLGLSSLTKYAKIGQTAPKYRPSTPVYTHGHDMFGLSVTMLDLFGERLEDRLYSPSEIRTRVKALKSVDSKIKNCLITMCPDDPHKAVTVATALFQLFGKRVSMDQCEPEIYENKLDMESISYLRDTVEDVCAQYRVNRAQRCYHCLFNFFNSEHGQNISRAYWPIYIGAAILIYSSLFGTKAFSEKEVLKVTSVGNASKYNIDELYDSLDVFLSDNNFISMTMKV